MRFSSQGNLYVAKIAFLLSALLGGYAVKVKVVSMALLE